MGKDFLLAKPTVSYSELSSDWVNALGPKEAEQAAMSLLAELATVTGKGKILRWSEFNENPDPLIDELLARILVGKIERSAFAVLKAEQMAILSIETSASYLAGAIAYEVADVFSLSRPPVIIRARKLPLGEAPSPAMGKHTVSVEVSPITAPPGKKRYLTASYSDVTNLKDVRLVLAVDDFKATGSTLSGGVALVRRLLNPQTIIPLAALGKPEQESVALREEAGAVPPITALDVTFWGDKQTGKAFIRVNGDEPYLLQKATATDFSV